MVFFFVSSSCLLTAFFAGSVEAFLPSSFGSFLSLVTSLLGFYEHETSVLNDPHTRMRIAAVFTSFKKSKV